MEEVAVGCTNRGQMKGCDLIIQTRNVEIRPQLVDLPTPCRNVFPRFPIDLTKLTYPTMA
jgi:hypothetical protein